MSWCTPIVDDHRADVWIWASLRLPVSESALACVCMCLQAHAGRCMSRTCVCTHQMHARGRTWGWRETAAQHITRPGRSCGCSRALGLCLSSRAWAAARWQWLTCSSACAQSMEQTHPQSVSLTPSLMPHANKHLLFQLWQSHACDCLDHLLQTSYCRAHALLREAGTIDTADYLKLIPLHSVC